MYIFDILEISAQESKSIFGTTFLKWWFFKADLDSWDLKDFKNIDSRFCRQKKDVEDKPN